MPDPTPDPLQPLIQRWLQSDHPDTLLEQLCKEHPEHADALRSRVARPAETVGAGSGSAAKAGNAGHPIQPKRIGSYRILDTLGEGGMGTVYLAEQKEPVQRRVALKVIKLGMDSKAVVQRFEQERQALALMDHEGIAKVFDCGTTELGQPFFVMELVKGIPLDQFCEQQQLSLQDRLALMMQVCAAAQHAHQKGVVHRDLKPGNVLVSDDGGRLAVKIIDFGLAKAMGQKLVEATLFTEAGQILGTPEYMAPEQADPTNQDIDTRADIYSLGVMLYEVLVSEQPFSSHALRQGGVLEIQRILREVEPPKPSTKLASVGRNATELARARRTSVGALLRAFKTDLDWVVLKALDKDRNRRYATANDLRSDLQRFLDGEPLLAGPPSASYRLRKFARKHRQPLLTMAAVVAVAVGGAITAISYARESAESERAAKEAQEREVRTNRQLRASLRTAESRRLALEVGQVTDPALALLLAKKSAEISPTTESRSVLALALARLQHDKELVGHTGHVLDAKASPDGRLLATVSADATARIWGIADGRQVAQFELGSKPYIWQTHIAWSPTGRRLALPVWASEPESPGWTLQIWDMATKARAYAVFTERFPVSKEGSFTPEGRVVNFVDDETLLIGRENRLELATLDSGPRVVRTLELPSTPSSVQVSPDGAFALVRCSMLDVVWRLEDGHTVKAYQHNQLDARGDPGHRTLGMDLSACFASDGASLFLAKPSEILALDLRTGKENVISLGPGHWVRIFNTHEGVIAIRGGEGKFGLSKTNLSKGGATRWVEIGRALIGWIPRADAIALDASGRYLIAGAEVFDILLGGSALRLSGELCAITPTHLITLPSFEGQSARALTWKLEGPRQRARASTARKVVRENLAAVLKTIDVETTTYGRKVFDLGGGYPREIAASGSRVFCLRSLKARDGAPASNALVCVDLAGDGRVRYEVPLEHNPIEIWLSPHDDLLAIQFKSPAETVAIRRQSNGELVGEIPVPNSSQTAFYESGVFFRPGQRIVVPGFHDSTTLWALKKNALVKIGDLNGKTHQLSADGQYALVSGRRNSMRLLDLDSGASRLEVPECSYAVFSADDTKVFAATFDAKVHAYIASSGELDETLVGHEKRVTNVIAKDGWVATYSAKEDRCRVWDASSGECLFVVPGRPQRFTQDGQWLVTRAAIEGGEPALQLWPLDPVQAAQHAQPRDFTEEERELFGVPDERLR